jgi:ABC-2 type transport system permease protein
LVNLILNENMKIYRRWRTWIMVGLMLALIITVSFIDWYYDSKDTTEDAWRSQVAQEKLDYEERLKDPKIQEGYRKHLQERIKLSNYRLDHDIQPTDDSMWSSIDTIAELVIVITMFTVIIAGDSLAGEFTSGTIKMLLIRPVSRLKILVSKYVSMILFGFLLVIILFVSSVLLNGLLYQFEHMNMPLLVIDDGGHVVEKNMVTNLWKTYLLNGVSTIMFVTMAFMISAAFRSSAMAIGFSIFAFFAGMMSLELVQRYEWSKYVLFANIDLTQHLDGRPFQEGMTLLFSITVLAVYFVIFNLVAWLVFTQRDVAA